MIPRGRATPPSWPQTHEKGPSGEAGAERCTCDETAMHRTKAAGKFGPERGTGGGHLERRAGESLRFEAYCAEGRQAVAG
jgi:hypothetical protein